MSRAWSVLGAPSGAGACGVGQDQGPAGIREAGLIDALAGAGSEVHDCGDSPVVPWRPDRERPQAQNLDAVVDVVRATASRVTEALHESGRTVLVLGGDCTVGIGTIAGVQQALGEVGVLYFDLHSDMNTPDTAPDGALDWMGLGHMLALDGTEAALAGATGKDPVLAPEQVLLFAHSMRQSTRFERSRIEELGMDRVGGEEVRQDPVGTAREALRRLTGRYDRYVIHLDVDVVDFTDAPLSEHPSRNSGLKLADMLTALQVLASGPGLVALTLAELNPHSAAADPGLLERFAASFADAITQPRAAMSS